MQSYRGRGSAIGIPFWKKALDNFCEEYHVGKQVKAFHKSVGQCTTNQVLELLHMDLMGLMQIESLGGQRYAFVSVDDFSRYT